MTRDELIQLLARVAIERGYRVSGDAYVTEACAASLLGLSPHTLKWWRYTSRPLQFRRIGGRISYSVEVLAHFLAQANEQAGEKQTETDGNGLDDLAVKPDDAPMFPRRRTAS